MTLRVRKIEDVHNKVHELQYMPFLIQLLLEIFLREIRNFSKNDWIRQGLKQAYKVTLKQFQKLKRFHFSRTNLSSLNLYHILSPSGTSCNKHNFLPIPFSRLVNICFLENDKKITQGNLNEIIKMNTKYSVSNIEACTTCF